MIIFKASGFLSNELIDEWTKGASKACEKNAHDKKDD